MVFEAIQDGLKAQNESVKFLIDRTNQQQDDINKLQEQINELFGLIKGLTDALVKIKG